MAFTAHQDPAMLTELRDTADTAAEKARQLAMWMREAKKVCVFTGAGISTAAGIADYRGPNGVWTLRAQGREDAIRSKDMMKALPTACHMALVKLMENGLLHHVISQNVDGLHRKSGVPAGKISELHGNTHLERCATCHREYLRDIDVTKNVLLDAATFSQGKSHLTGRRCAVASCNGPLEDTIVHFGEGLPVNIVTQGFEQSDASDLHIVLGSSLTVAPACKMPQATKENGGRLVIVNLQKTPLDPLADMKVHAKCDDFLTTVLRELDLVVPAFALKRRLCVWRSGGDLNVSSVDAADDDEPTMLVKSITPAAGKVTVGFEGHYGEPDVDLPLSVEVEAKLDDSIALFDVSYRPDASPEAEAWQTHGCRVVAMKSAGTPEGMAPPRAEMITCRPGNKRVVLQPAAPAPPKNYNLGGGFNVTPLETCPHCDDVPQAAAAAADGVDPAAPCTTCGHVGENMLCLICNEVHCGRHVEGHMVKHHEATGHPLVMGFSDLSCWCFACDSYIDAANPRLSAYYTAYHVAKFGEVPPYVTPQSRGAAFVARVCAKYGVSTPALTAPPAAPAVVDDDDEPMEMFSVYPAPSCPHTPSLPNPSSLSVDPRAPCGACGNVGENMMCLTCQKVFCGRHVKEHMLEHHDETGHPIVCGFKDLSFWCYPCETYLLPTNPSVAPYHAALYVAKFGELPPNVRGQITEASDDKPSS
eukprot:TRINITY_DN918_c0_g2_i1.p1 TRINITY_DN918_c0_g2~~TRINITY_DN918_c0_g2_i1.p1  ORF type:complete len:702 (+),score=195.46 TRINITY_DN918_c0_g2_i1:129-2234(+)